MAGRNSKYQESDLTYGIEKSKKSKKKKKDKTGNKENRIEIVTQLTETKKTKKKKMKRLYSGSGLFSDPPEESPAVYTQEQDSGAVEALSSVDPLAEPDMIVPDGQATEEDSGEDISQVSRDLSESEMEGNLDEEPGYEETPKKKDKKRKRKKGKSLRDILDDSDDDEPLVTPNPKELQKIPTKIRSLNEIPSLSSPMGREDLASPKGKSRNRSLRTMIDKNGVMCLKSPKRQNTWQKDTSFKCLKCKMDPAKWRDRPLVKYSLGISSV
jgi:hypothetical protein